MSYQGSSIWDSWNPITNRPEIDVEQDIEPPAHIDHEAAYVSPFDTQFNIIESQFKIPPSNPFRIQGITRAPRMNDDPRYTTDVYFTKTVYQLNAEQKQRAADELGVDVKEIPDYDTAVYPEDVYWPPNLAMAEATKTYIDGTPLATREGLFNPQIQSRIDELTATLNNPATSAAAFDQAKRSLDDILARNMAINEENKLQLYESLADRIVQDADSVAFVGEAKQEISALKQVMRERDRVIAAGLLDRVDQPALDRLNEDIQVRLDRISRLLYKPNNFYFSRPTNSLPLSTTIDQDYANIAEYLAAKNTGEGVAKLFKEEYKTDPAKAKTRAEILREEKIKAMMRATDPTVAANLQSDVKDLDLIIKFYGSKKWVTGKPLQSEVPRAPGSYEADISAAYAGGNVLRNPAAAAVYAREPLGQLYIKPARATSEVLQFIPESVAAANRTVSRSELEPSMVKYHWPSSSGVYDDVMGNTRFLIEKQGRIGDTPRDFFPQFKHRTFE